MSSPPTRHDFEWEDAAGVAVVRFTTTTLRDDRIIHKLFDQIEHELIGTGRTNIVVNFSGLEAFASYAIGKLIALNEKVRKDGGRLALCDLPPVVNEIIDLMSLRKRFPIYASEHQALESFT